MSEDGPSAASLFLLVEKYAKTDDPELLRQIEKAAGECPSAVFKAFVPLAALALRNKEITATELRSHLSTAERIQTVVYGDLVEKKVDASTIIEDSTLAMAGGQIGGQGNQAATAGVVIAEIKGKSMNRTTAFQIVALILGTLAIMGISLAAVWVKDPKIIAFIFGVIFISVMLIIAIRIPNPTPSQVIVFRTVLAICVAGAAALVPGFLEVEIGKYVRAGGAMAVFVIVYFFSPAKLVISGPSSTAT